MTWLSQDSPSIEIRLGIRDGVVQDRPAVPVHLEQLGNHFQVPPPKHYHCRRATKRRCDQPFEKRTPAPVIFAIIAVMEMQDATHRKGSGHVQENNLTNGYA